MCYYDPLPCTPYSLPISSIVTKTGDDGSTGLYGSARVRKTDPRIAAIGDVDELNAVLGCIIADIGRNSPLADGLTRVQHQLFILGADLATPDTAIPTAKRIEERHVHGLEEWISAIESSLPPLTQFILPSGSPLGAQLHHARTVCRRTERSMVALAGEAELNPHARVFINRLSDLLFVLARGANRDIGMSETPVSYES